MLPILPAPMHTKTGRALELKIQEKNLDYSRSKKLGIMRFSVKNQYKFLCPSADEGNSCDILGP